jgi:hypothetical protein
MTDSHHDPAGHSRLVRYLRFALLIGIVIALNMGGNWLAGQLNLQLFPRHEALISIMVLAAACLYIGLMAIPFMPGIEIGLALMMLLGSKGALLVYLCTLVALSLSFLIGRIIPPPPDLPAAELAASSSGWRPGQAACPSEPATTAGTARQATSRGHSTIAVKIPLPDHRRRPEPARQCPDWRGRRHRPGRGHEQAHSFSRLYHPDRPGRGPGTALVFLFRWLTDQLAGLQPRLR